MFGTATDTAENLMKFAAGPAFLGIAGLITYATKVLGSDERSSKKGWFALAAGIALVLWLAVFVAWASVRPVTEIEIHDQVGHPTSGLGG